MPRVNSLTFSGKIQDNLIKLTKETRNSLMDAGITYTKIARALNISPQAVSRQFARGNHITIEVWLTAQMMLEEVKDEN